MRAPRPFVLLSWIGLASVASAQSVEFSANHVFLSDFGLKQIVEFDESGAFVRAIDLSTGPNIVPTGLAFGPEGLLHIGSGLSTSIVAIDGTGEVAATATNPAILNVEAVEFDTLGRYLVTSYNFGDLIRMPLDGSSATVLYDGTTPLYDLEIDDFGFIVTSPGALGQTRFFEVDGTGTLSNATSLGFVSGGVFPHGAAVEFGGTLVVSDSAHPRVISGTSWIGAVPDTIDVPLATGPIEDVDFAPDGRLLLVDSTQGRIVAVGPDGESEVFASSPNSPPYAVYLAVAPFRFDTIVRGRVRDGSGAMVQILESAVVSIQPASRRVMFRFTDDPEQADDFVSVTGIDRLVANGKVTGIGAPGPLRSIHARAPRDALSRNDVTVTCDTKRKFDEAGFERVISASGSLWCGGSDSQIHLTFKTKKVLNP
ncbi:MAG: hypothetical protein JNL94_14770 [Planctomycetes bacterium]|nr:hypothetical protein [Planctomycetota bacterium]